MKRIGSVALLVFAWCLHVGVAQADATVTTIEHGAWPVAVTALQSDLSSQGSAVSVCVHDDGAQECSPCGSYALSFDEAGAAAFDIGACNPATGATTVTLVDRSALFDHGHTVPRPRAITIQAEVVRSIATSGGAAVTGGSSVGCTARVRPFLHDLEHGADIPLGPDRFRVAVQHAAVTVSQVGDGWMFVSESQIVSSVDYDVIEISSGETVMSGHTTLECASTTTTDTIGRTPVDRSGPWVEALPATPHHPIVVHYGNLPTVGSPWIAIASLRPGSSTYISYVYTGAQASGTVTLEGVEQGMYEVRAYHDSGYTVVATYQLNVGMHAPTGSPSLRVSATQSSQPISVEYGGLPENAWVSLTADGTTTPSQALIAADGDGILAFAGMAAGSYHLEAYIPSPYVALTSAGLIVADSLEPVCLAASPVGSAAEHFDLPADGAVTRSVRFRTTRVMRVAIEGHSVGRLALYSTCNSSPVRLAQNRQVDVGAGHARITYDGLPVGTYEIRVSVRGDEAASIDVTPNHVPMIVDMRSGFAFGLQDGMLGLGAMGEIDFRFEMGTNNYLSGGVGFEMLGENYQCSGNYGAHGCGSGTSGSLRMDAYTLLLPAFLDIGPPRDSAAFRFRIQLSPGLVVSQGELGSSTFTSVMPVVMGGGGFDIDIGPMAINFRAGARFTSVTTGSIEVLGIGFVGSAGLSLSF